jgi:HEAT repeat protein
MMTKKTVSVWRGVGLGMVLAAAGSLGACGKPQKDEEPLSSPTFERAMVVLQTQAHSPDPTVRANCIEALQVSHDPRGLEIIEQGLHDKEWVVRFAAAMAAGQRKAQSMRPVLNTLVTMDPNANVRVGCVYALRRMGDVSHWGDLGMTMESPDPGVRANTALVVGMYGDERDGVLLQRYRNDPDVRVRFEITAALARLGDKEAQKVIVSESVNKFAEDQYNAMEVCGYLPLEVAIDPLLLGLQGPATTTAPAAGVPMELTIRRQLIAARSLARLRNGSGAQIALEQLKNPDPGLRALACLALGEMLTGWQAPGLEPLLSDPNDGVQRAAAAAVVKIYARVAAKR